jgi:RNA polymerase sigma factor, sigma-70 family
LDFVTKNDKWRQSNMTMYINDSFYIKKVRAGDIQAFSVIVSRYKDKVFSIVYRIVNNREDAEDLTQEIFIKLYKSISNFKNESEFSTWVYRIAYNTTITELRKRKITFFSMNENPLLVNEGEWIDEIGDNENRTIYLQKALASLSPDDLFVVSLHHIEDKSIREIANAMNQTESNIKVKLHRIRKKLAQEINRMMKEDLQ